VITYADSGRRLMDCRNCGQAARVDVHGERLVVTCFARCDQDAALEGVDLEELLAEIRYSGEAPDGGAKQKPSKATLLVGLAINEGAELFHTPEGEAYATVPIDGRRETWPLKTKTIRRWLARLFYQHRAEAPGSQAVQDAIAVLEGKALFDGVEHTVHVRTAEHDGQIYLDLADAEWRAVAIAPGSGWKIVTSAPVRFKRARGMLPLPTPVRGGSLEELRPFLNYAGENDFRLMVAWLVMALRPVGPYPVLALHGEQGSGKSTAAEALRMIIDPNEALLRPPPRDERDLVIAGSNGRVVALENLSHIAQWLSDALCRIATGSGFATRELYTDADEAIFSVQLPIVVNGIVEVVIAGDLQDRSIVLTLPTIEEYVSEDDLWDAFEAARPRILGSLLDVISHAMANERSVEIAELPRMADFARWTAAACPALGWDAHELLAAYAHNRANANETTLDASPLVAPLRELGNFEGTATELLAALVEIVGDGPARSKVWPKSPSALSGAVRRLAPNLRRTAPPIAIEFQREGRDESGKPSGRRVIRVGETEWVHKRASSPSSDDADDADDGVLHTHSSLPVPVESDAIGEFAAEAGIEFMDGEL
jgi:hypothetical protein